MSGVEQFLLSRIAEDENTATALLKDLAGQVQEEYAGAVDERGPMTPARLLSAQMWAHYDGQTKRRSFAKGQQIAQLASPGRVLAECAAKRAIIESYQNVCKQAEKTNDLPNQLVLEGMQTGLHMALVALTYPYKDHTDHKKEWAEPGGVPRG